MSLWPHQEFALQELDRCIERGIRRVCVTIPTGGGKTAVMFEHIRKMGSAAVYTDRRMLLQQIAAGLDDAGLGYGVRAAGYEPRLLSDIQLCMVQTEGSRSLDGNRDVHRARAVYIDELHKNTGETMQQLCREHGERGVEITIGMTATPLGVSGMADHLIVAATNSDLRRCGALVPAMHYAPDEPDTKWIGKVAIDEGECGIATGKRREYAHRVFGRVVEHYDILNPDRLPAILFAPGVKESVWFAENLTEQGIPAAHIDGENVWFDGRLHTNKPELRDEIADRSKSGSIKVVCNRFVMREGINWPWLYHGIFATVFGSLTSYIQAGGRLLRAYPGLDHVIVQDHGGNSWRHGSINEDREWRLEYTDRIVAGMRESRLREKKEPEPIVCPKCYAMRLAGPLCYECGYRHGGRSRLVMQKDGSLREVKGDIFRRRRMLSPTEQVEREWNSRASAIRKSQKPTVRNMTFAQLEVSFARDHGWQYAPRDTPGMPANEIDFYRPVRDVPRESLIPL